MANYKRSEDLIDKTVDFCDLVILGKRLHQVMDSYLKNLDVCNNSEVFETLNLDKFTFCEEHYGYPPLNTDFPKSKKEDYEALTRLVIALMKLSEKNN